MSWWRSRPFGLRVALVVVAFVIGLSVLVSALNGLTGGGPSGSPASSYATSSDGVAGWADLLAKEGHPVVRLRVTLDKATLPAPTTIVVIDAPVDAAEVDALRAALSRGGRVVLGGDLAAPAFDRLVGGRTHWSGGGPTTARPASAAARALLPGVTQVESDGDGAWSDPGGGRALLAGGRSNTTVALTASVGSGQVFALADPSPLFNRQLDRVDNAAFAVDLAGPAGAPVAFAEVGHGYGQRSGAGALPTGWQHAFWLALVAVAAAMWAAGKRLGPADPEGAALPPARTAYVEAVAATLARSGDREAAVAPLRAAARRSLAHRAGLDADADDQELERVAQGGGVDPGAVRAVLGRVETDDDVLALGRAVAGMEDGRW